MFYSVRSERQLMEQLRCNLLFPWFVGLTIDDAIWDHWCSPRTATAARLYRKSHNTASTLCYQGHVLMENRTGRW